MFNYLVCTENKFIRTILCRFGRVCRFVQCILQSTLCYTATCSYNKHGYSSNTNEYIQDRIWDSFDRSFHYGTNSYMIETHASAAHNQTTRLDDGAIVKRAECIWLWFFLLHSFFWLKKENKNTYTFWMLAHKINDFLINLEIMVKIISHKPFNYWIKLKNQLLLLLFIGVLVTKQQRLCALVSARHR